MKYKLLALDMDGTLLNEEKHISKENRKWIQAALDAGVSVCLSTGRGVQTIDSYIADLQLATPIVAVNGSEVWSKPGELYRRILMQPDTIRKLHSLAEKYETWFWTYTTVGMFNRAKWIEDFEAYEWLKFGYQTPHPDRLNAIRGELEQMGEFEITNSNPDNLEINPIGISKASGLREVCGMLGITMSEVVAMGDSENDMAMIQAVGLGIAMGNAQPAVKLAADLVTVTNDEDAVAKVIQEIILV